jgi:hypothetical protein
VALEEYRAPAKVKLAALWASAMICFIYGIGLLGHATPDVLTATSLMMAVPSLMAAVPLFLPARICRWTCIVLSLFPE